MYKLVLSVSYRSRVYKMLKAFTRDVSMHNAFHRYANKVEAVQQIMNVIQEKWKHLHLCKTCKRGSEHSSTWISHIKQTATWMKRNPDYNTFMFQAIFSTLINPILTHTVMEYWCIMFFSPCLMATHYSKQWGCKIGKISKIPDVLRASIIYIIKMHCHGLLLMLSLSRVLSTTYRQMAATKTLSEWAKEQASRFPGFYWHNCLHGMQMENIPYCCSEQFSVYDIEKEIRLRAQNAKN